MKRPFGYFVHHQGRGHAERCAAIAQALPADRPLIIFCARESIFPSLPSNAELKLIPSLFERRGDEAEMLDHVATPAALHCAPLGWPSIRRAMATIVNWFDAAAPALMICDVSAEIAQLSRICSVPHVKVLQHGNRGDVGHQAAYDGAIGLLAPFHADLAQADWTAAMRAKTCFAGGLGVGRSTIDRMVARQRLGLPNGDEVILVMSGSGGNGFSQAPLSLGARSRPTTRWITIGPVERDWHATEPANLEHRGWVDNAADYIAASDLVIASTGNTTSQQILGAARPWLATPEWRYFDEQHRKAEALAAVGAAFVCPHLPSSVEAWAEAISCTYAAHQPARQLALIEHTPAKKVVLWLEELSIWSNAASKLIVEEGAY